MQRKCAYMCITNSNPQQECTRTDSKISQAHNTGTHRLKLGLKRVGVPLQNCAHGSLDERVVGAGVDALHAPAGRVARDLLGEALAIPAQRTQQTRTNQMHKPINHKSLMHNSHSHVQKSASKPTQQLNNRKHATKFKIPSAKSRHSQLQTTGFSAVAAYRLLWLRLAAFLLLFLPDVRAFGAGNRRLLEVHVS